MCHECRAYDCAGCLPVCDACGLETHAQYDAHEARRVCGDCRAAEALERCTDCHRALPGDFRGLCATCAMIENERWNITSDVLAAPVLSRCVDCDEPATLDARHLCSACGERHDQADRECVLALRRALRGPRKPRSTPTTETAQRRVVRDHDEQTAMIGVAARLASERAAANDDGRRTEPRAQRSRLDAVWNVLG